MWRPHAWRAQIHKFRFFFQLLKPFVFMQDGFLEQFPKSNSRLMVIQLKCRGSKCILYTGGPLPTILYLVSFWPPKLAWGKCLKLDVKEYSLKDIQTTVPSRVFGRWIYYVLRASSEHDRCRCQRVNARIMEASALGQDPGYDDNVSQSSRTFSSERPLFERTCNSWANLFKLFDQVVKRC